MPRIHKIAYFGSDDICLPGLRFLHEQCRELCEIVAVVSQPDRRQGRGKRLQQNPVAAYASENRLHLLQPPKPDAALGEFLRVQGVELAFVMAYGHFIGKSVREAPTHGMLNFHGSILPAYRGASPVEAAIANGESETGVCLMQVVREMDAGSVADCEKVGIDDVDTAVDLRARIGEAVVPLLKRNLKAALSAELVFAEQDHSAATYCRKIAKNDAALDFYLPARLIDCRLRAFTPWPGGYFDHEGTRLKVGRAGWIPVTAGDPEGTIVSVGESLDVATSDGILQIFELQRPGGRMIPVKDFVRGYPIESGEVLPSVPSEMLLRLDQR
ncbi:MAG: methionyl-tRNA formyltransferase [Opitutales bacterium]